MQQHPDNISSTDAEEENFSFRQLVTDWWLSILFALRFWRIIAVAVILGALIGAGYAYTRKITYSARLTFVVEEPKSGAGSIASSLAGQFGLDIGGISGGNGILSGDNVLELLKSETFVKKALLTPYVDSASTVSLADRYADVYEWKEAWRNSPKVGKQVDFPVNKEIFTRTEDSLIHIMMKNLIDRELVIGKPDKKLGLFQLLVTTRDERFSQLFCERVLKIATDFYVDTKTRRLSMNVARLQRRADSLGILLDRKTYSSVDAEKMLLDANPAYSSPIATAEISSRNKYLQGTVYGEVIKNLEMSRMALSQETPTVQIVDRPEMPLKKNRTSYLFSMIAGMAIAFGTTLILLASRRKS